MSVGSAVAGFTVVAALLTIVPGLDTALVLRAALTQGRSLAAVTALGISTGALAWGAGAAVGVSALLTASRVAFDVVRIAGAAYMAWMGLRLLRSALRRVADDDSEEVPVRAGGHWSAWRTGLLTNLLNPKIGAFYVAVLPQFLPAGVSPLAMGVLLALVHDALGLAWFALLITAASAMRGALRRPVARRAVDALTGSALVGFGLKLGLTSR